MDDCVTPSTSRHSATETNFEIALVLLKSLATGPFSNLASRLAKEIDESGIVPNRIDFEGTEHKQTIEEYLSRHGLSSETVQSLLDGDKRQKKVSNTRELQSSQQNPFHWKRASSQSILLKARTLGFRIPAQRFHDFEHCFNYQYAIVGHVDNAYNVRFDRNGRFALTGADDGTIKVWDTSTAMLKYTFRGHTTMVCDMDISHCNQFMASVGTDKLIRIWDLQTGAQLPVGRNHTNVVASLHFIPKVYKTSRWLVSFGNDCNVIFYEFDEQEKVFGKRVSIFNVRTAPGLKVLCGNVSPCGDWVAAGDSHGFAHLFRFESDTFNVDIDFRTIAVQEKLDTLEWANTTTAFLASSSRHHAGRIWRLINGTWHFLEFSPKLDKATLELLHSTKLKFGFRMGVWSLDDSKIVTSGTDNKVRVFDSFTAEQQFCLEGHVDEVYHIKKHPVHPDIVVTMGHDGFILIWNIEQGRLLKKFANTALDADGDLLSSAIYDCNFSPDGTSLATVDNIGRLTIYSHGGHDGYKVPKEQFFSSDYEAMDHDDQDCPVDLSTGLPPHLNLPPWLTDIDHRPYEEKWQRRVPGREKVTPDDGMLECTWLRRKIVPKLEESHRNCWIERQTSRNSGVDLYLSSNDSRLRLYKPLGSEAPVPPKNPSSSSTRRRVIPTMEELVREQEARRAQFLNGYPSDEDSDYEHDDHVAVVENGLEATDEVEDEEEEGSDSGSSSDDTYGDVRSPRERERENESEAVTTSSGRRVRSRNPQFVVSEARPSRKTRSRPVAEAEDQVNDEDTRDGPDSVAVDEPGPSSETRKPVKEKKKKRTDQIPATFPQIMQMVKPTRFPYVAQVGDSVVYCKQGHLNYLSKVELLGVYSLGKKAEPPSNVKAEELCIVDEVKYTLYPYRLTCLKLSQVNKRNERTGKNFSIKFHDLDDCPDFIILRQIYDNVTSKPLNEGDEMEALIDGSWWTGSVTSKSAFSDEYPQSSWNLLHIRWDNGDEERMCPWDCQKKTPGRKSSSSASPDEELELGQYMPTDEDWPGNERPQLNMQEHCERLYAAIIKLSELDTIAPFAYPVNLSEFTDYAAHVSYCIDLQTIAERLKNRYYRRLKAVQHDIRQIAIAAEQYNEPSSIIVENSRRLVEALIRFSRDSSYLDPEDMVKLYDTMFDLGMEEITAYREKDVLPVSTEIIHMALASDQSAAQEPGWKVETRRILSTVFKLPCAKPFYDKDAADDQVCCLFNLFHRNLPTIRTALAESGDLKSVLDELHLFNQPDAVIGKIKDIMDHCREVMQRDLQRRKYDDAIQLVKSVEQKMKAVVDEFNSVMESMERQGISVRRNLRQRAPKVTAYQTRSHVPQPSSSGRTTTEPGFYSQLASGRASISRNPLAAESRAARALRRTMSGETSTSTVRESTVERERRPRRPPPSRRMSVPHHFSGSDHDDLIDDHEAEEEMEEEAYRNPRRKADQREREELEDDLRDIIEAEEERMDSRRVARNRKRKRNKSDSDEEYFSGDSRSTTRSRKLRSTRRSTRHVDESEEEGQESVSLYGRVRRKRHLD